METPHFTTSINDTRADIFDKVSDELWGDISEAISDNFSTPTDMFAHVQAMREITDRITDMIPTGVRSAVYLDHENHDLKKVEPINN